MAEMITITIDGVSCTGQKGDSVLKIAAQNGVEIPSLCHNETVKVYGACGLCVVECEGVPKLLRACATAANDGAVYHVYSERCVRARKVALELLMSDHVGDCRGPCVLHCPAGTNCQKYIAQIKDGDFTGAVKTIKEKIPLPASIGRVCPHPCEEACRREMVDEPVSIAYLKAYAADKDLAGNTYRPEVAPETGKTVTVIGGGPAGLSAAYYLRRKGHKVRVLDAQPKMGGMLRYGIPEYRLPKAILDREIEEIKAIGVEMVNDVKLGKDVQLEDIRKISDATVLAVGAWKSSSMRCPGEEMEGVLGGIGFLKEAADYVAGIGKKPEIGENVAIVGGGNVAMDACRTAVRLGAKNVYVIYRRTRKEMPAEDIEIKEAEEEGVTFKFLCAPAEIIGENGRAKTFKLQKMELGEPDASGRRSPVAIPDAFELLAVDTVIGAIGQATDKIGLDGIELNRKGCICADEATFRTSLPDVFAVGDATNKGAGIAIAAIGEGDKAAAVIDSFLKGKEQPYVAPYYSEKVVTADMLSDRTKEARAVMAQLTAEERCGNFREVNLGFTDEQAKKEAGRCLECGCHDYDECRLIHNARDPKLAIDPSRFAGEKSGGGKDQKLVCIERDTGKCVLCGLCVRVCDEVAKKGILGIVNRGFNSVIKPEFRDPAVIADCKNCLKCAEACPTGALRILK